MKQLKTKSQMLNRIAELSKENAILKTFIYKRGIFGIIDIGEEEIKIDKIVKFIQEDDEKEIKRLQSELSRRIREIDMLSINKFADLIKKEFTGVDLYRYIGDEEYTRIDIEEIIDNIKNKNF